MGFLGISQLSTAAYSPALSLSDRADTPAAGVDADPTSFAQVCTRAADSLATSGLGPQSIAGSSPLGSLLGLLSSLFGAQASGGGAAAGAGGLAAALPGIAKTVAGLLA